MQTLRDPVCGKTLEPPATAFTAKHREAQYHFCSALCRDRFLEIPTLYTLARADLLETPRLHQHRLKPTAASRSALAAAQEKLTGAWGIHQVNIDGTSLLVEYDTLRISLALIEAELATAGLDLKGGWHNLQRGYWKFTERNELDNLILAGKGACCSRPPPRLR